MMAYNDDQDVRGLDETYDQESDFEGSSEIGQKGGRSSRNIDSSDTARSDMDTNNEAEETELDDDMDL